MRKALPVLVFSAIALAGFVTQAKADPILSGSFSFQTILSLQTVEPDFDIPVLPPGVYVDASATWFPQCQHFFCGDIIDGTISAGTPTFSFEGYFLPGGGSLYTAFAACGPNDYTIDGEGWGTSFVVTQFDGKAGRGQGYFNGVISPICGLDGTPLASTFSLDFGASLQPVPEPSTLLLLTTGLLIALLGVGVRNVMPNFMRKVSDTGTVS